ncbi:MAG TPA: hypothetical protein VF220_01410, partial [Nitrososphaeraceae archaeon]
IEKWVMKAYNSIINKIADCVVILLPARVDTKWFHLWVYHKAEIRFLKGRLTFRGAINPAPFPSIVVIYRKSQ